MKRWLGEFKVQSLSAAKVQMTIIATTTTIMFIRLFEEGKVCV